MNMTRTVEVALVPVFQFGVFCDGDCAFFAGPPMPFAGRVHTNGDLYLSAGNGGLTTFEDKVSAWGNVIRQVQENGNATTANHNGTVDLLTTSLGCPGGLPGCRAMALTEGSVTGGPTSGAEPGMVWHFRRNLQQLDYRWKLWKPGRHRSHKTLAAIHQQHTRRGTTTTTL